MNFNCYKQGENPFISFTLIFHKKSIALFWGFFLFIVTPSVSNAQTCTGNVVAVTSETGIETSASVLGAADGLTARLREQNDVFVLDLGSTINAGSTITLRWFQNSGTPLISVETSSSGGSGFAPVTGSPFSVTSGALTNLNVTVNGNTRYVRITNTNSGTRLEIDAITYTNQPCGPSSSPGGTFPASACDLIGQYTTTAGFTPNYTQATLNNNNGSAYALGFSGVHDIELDAVNHRMFVVDQSNSRVLVFNLDANNNLVDKTPDFVLGQPNFTTAVTTPVTQSRMFGPRSSVYDAARNWLFVADGNNSRVLVFDVATITNGEDAIHVLGQANFTTVYDPMTATMQEAIKGPIGMAYDATNKRLFVVENTNNRVVVFDVNTVTDGENPVNVLGQDNFITGAAATSQKGMSAPLYATYDATNQRLFVSASGNNRITVYDVATITDGENAINVLGQPDYTTSTAATTQSRMNAPRDMAYDNANNRLFVADGGNNRVLVFDIETLTNGEAAIDVLGQADYSTSTAVTTQSSVSSTRGLLYDAANRKLYVTQFSNNRISVFCLTTAPGGVTGAAVWLKADVGVTTGATLTWADQSSNSRNATQTTVANQPTVPSAVFNFNPALFFDGTNDNLILQNTAGLPTGASQVQQFAVSNHTNSANGANARILGYGTDAIGQSFFLGKFTNANPMSSIFGTDVKSTFLEYTGNAVALTEGKYTGTNLTFSSFGVQMGSTAYTPSLTSTAGRIGASLAGTADLWTGNIPEIILYPTNLTATQYSKVNSYLALKYGITLDQTSANNYLASDGTTIWNGTTNSGNRFNIAGIARDDASALSQKQSKSVNAGLQVIMGNGNTITTTNILNTSTFSADKSALIWGDNAGSVAAWTTTGAPPSRQIVARKWKVQETGTVGYVKVQIPDNSGTNGLPAETNTIYLLADADGDFTSGATEYAMTLNGTNWEAPVDFTTGQFFTFATQNNSPVNLNLAMTGDRTTVSSGQNIVYTLTLTNSGATTATNVRVKDQLPAGVNFVSATPSVGTYNSATGIWLVPTIATGAQTLTITVTAQ
jgi:uncharacterized repeat protein (TIGR01451 family)